VKRVLIGQFGSIVRLGLRELLENEDGCDVVAEESGEDEVLDRLLAALPDVVVLDLDDEPGAAHLVRTITSGFPAVTIIACSSQRPAMQVFPSFHRGESYTSELSPELLIEAVKKS
jgi:DNA-binding NarL/FixJ family response regulator